MQISIASDLEVEDVDLKIDEDKKTASWNIFFEPIINIEDVIKNASVEFKVE